MRRVLRGVGGAVGSLLVFTAATALGVVANLDRPVTRRFVAARVNEALAPIFEGRLEIERVDHIGLDGIAGASVRITAPDGVDVVRAEGVAVRVPVLDILRSVIFGKGDIEIHVTEASIDHADVRLDDDATHAPEIARAFELRDKTPSTGKARGVHLLIPKATISTGWVHGKMPDVPAIDADLRALGGSVEVTSEGVRVRVDGAGVQSRGMPRGLDANGQASGGVTVPHDGVLVIDGAYEGELGGVPLRAHAKVAGDAIDGVADVPHVSGERLHALLPEVPVRDEVGAHVEVHGTLPNLRATATVTSGEAKLNATADATLGASTKIVIDADAEHVDVQNVAPSAPHSVLAAKAHAELSITGGVLSATYDGRVPGGTLDGQTLPTITVSGTLSHGPQGLKGTANAQLTERGASGNVHATIVPDGSSVAVNVTGRVSMPRLDAFARVKLGVKGSATAQFSGRIRPSKQTVDATVEVDARDLDKEGTRVAHAHVIAKISGKIASPAISTTVTADGIEAGRLKYAHAEAKTRGSIKSQRVEAELKGDGAADVHAQATVDIGSTVAIHDVTAVMERDRMAVRARARAVRIGAEGIRVDDAVVEGLGAPARASVSMHEGTTRIRARSRGVSLVRVARILGIEEGTIDGRVDFEVDLALGKNGATGRVRADIWRATVLGAHNASAHLEATAEGKLWDARVHADVGDVGYADITTSDVTLTASKNGIDAAAWKRITGRVDLDAKIDLAKLVGILPEPTRTKLTGSGGQLAIAGSIIRTTTDGAPELAMQAKTEGLSVSVAPKTRVTGVDASLDVKVDGRSGATIVDARAWDRAGEVVAIDARADSVAYAELFSGSDAKARLESTAFTASIDVPSRALAKLPAGYALADTHGDVGAHVDFKGTVREPRATGRVRIIGYRSIDASAAGQFDADLEARYDGSIGNATLSVDSKKGRLLSGSARANVKMADLLAQKPGEELPWGASAEVQLLAFPIQRFGTLADRGVRGRLSGSINVRDLHKDAHADGQITLEALQLGDVKYKDAKLTFNAGDGALDASVRLDQSDGYLETRAQTGLAWGRALVPALDPAHPIDVKLTARNLQAAGLEPFVDTVLGQLDGRIDADAHLAVDTKGVPSASGSVTFSDGIVQIAALGTELHDVKAKLTLKPDGTLRLDDVSASGVTGKVVGSAAARLRGLHLAEATAALEIPSGQALPLDIRGAQLGDVDGKMTMRATTSDDGKRTDIAVQVPVMHIELPLASAHAATDRPVLSNVHVGVYNGDSFLPILLAPAPDASDGAAAAREIDVKVHLGPDVQIKRGASLRVALEGDPAIKMNGETSVIGQIELKSGVLQVQGKKFEIETGTVTFSGTDPGNPLVVVTAGWTAADGTRVYADFKGPLKTGKVTLRSEPARPKDEILALILFGSADQSSYATAQSNGGAQAGSAAGSAAGAIATEGLSEGLDELTGLDIATNIDTTNAANPRPEVEVQIARNISLQIAVVLGTPAPGQNPDTAYATIDWRFTTRWSLETTFGDQGTSFADLVWQYRY